jgi:hypothetical protein
MSRTAAVSFVVSRVDMLWPGQLERLRLYAAF